jgi:tRNA-specific 2-thiouridylase
VVLFGNISDEHLLTAAKITAGYTKSLPGDLADIKVFEKEKETIVQIITPTPGTFEDLMI